MAPSCSTRWQEMMVPCVLLAALALVLAGCGGGGHGPSPSPKPTPSPTPPPAPGPAPPAPLGELRPLRGIAYNAVPCSKSDVDAGGACNTQGVPQPGLDLVQEGYKQLWGPDGRDDLGTVQRLGGNAVRLYAALGLESQHDHGAFLDRAKDLGIHVMPGFYTQMPCPDFNCFKAWKAAAAAAFKKGFKQGDTWHPVVPLVVLQNQPDSLNFGGVPPPVCPDGEDAVCRVRAALSAMDGLLQAEKEAGVKGGANLTIAWSSDTKDSIDGVVKQAIGYYGFQDMVAGVAKPDLAKYEPVSSQEELQTAFDSRWTHSTNTASPWAFVKEKVGDNYDRFLPKPWFVSEFRGDAMDGNTYSSNLKALEGEAKSGGPFLGAVTFSFQNEYEIPAAQLYGLYGLGPGSSGKTDDVCQEDVNTHVSHCNKWTVYCLNATQGQLDRAKGVAKAWNGTSVGHGACSGSSKRVEITV